MSKAAVKTISRLNTNPKILEYLKKQETVKASLRDIQKSLSNIGISLAKRVIEDREKR